MWKTVIASPVGELHCFATDLGLSGLIWPEVADSRFDTNQYVDSPNQQVFEQLSTQLCEYFAGSRRLFDVPLAPTGTEFQRLAWNALGEIPYGETRSYRQQAAKIGRPSAVRAIGAANGKNPISILIPCHRVIASDGKLTGFAGGIDAKRFLLNHEANICGVRRQFFAT